jgi:hypothetical protein
MSETNWPLDDEGRPMIKISYQMGEKIGSLEDFGLPKFSSLATGPATVSLFVKQGQQELFPDNSDAVGLAQCVNDLARLVLVDVMAEQREIVFKLLDPAKK